MVTIEIKHPKPLHHSEHCAGAGLGGG
jgi:hypothetical protein